MARTAKQDEAGELARRNRRDLAAGKRKPFERDATPIPPPEHHLSQSSLVADKKAQAELRETAYRIAEIEFEKKKRKQREEKARKHVLRGTGEK